MRGAGLRTGALEECGGSQSFREIVTRVLLAWPAYKYRERCVGSDQWATYWRERVGLAGL